MRTSEMSPSRFWQFIDVARSESDGNLDAEVDNLTQQLAQLSPDEIIQFQNAMNQCVALADRWNLRGAVQIINGDCNDQSFSEFRGWLISQGRQVFEEVLEDPEALVDVIESDISCPAILNAASAAYKSRTQSSMPEQSPPEVEPAGEEWIEADLPEMFPRLWEQFGEDDDGE